MNRYLLFIICYWCMNFAFGQSLLTPSQLDSLKKELNTPEKVNRYFLAQQHRLTVLMFTNSDSASNFARQQKQVSQAFGHVSTEVRTWIALANLYFLFSNEKEKGLLFLDSGMQVLAEKDKDQLLIEERGLLLHGYGRGFQSMAQPQKAMDKFKEAEDWFSRSSETSAGLCMVYNSMGGLLRNEGNRKAALEFYIKSAKCYEGTKQLDPNSAHTFNNVSLMLNEDGLYDQAIEYLQKAIAVYSQFSGGIFKGNAHMNLGISFENTQKFDSSLYHYQQALSIFESRGNEENLASIYVNLGTFHYRQKNWEESLSFYEKALALDRKSGFARYISQSAQNLAMAYEKMGKPQKALPFVQEAWELAQQNENWQRERSEALETLADVYFKLGKPEQAFQYHKQFKAVSDSLNHSRNNREWSALKTQFEVDRKDNEIASLKTQEELQRKALQAEKEKNYYFMGGIAISVIALIVFAVFYQKLKTARAQLEAANRTKDKFFSIVAHDLRNPVVAFHGLAYVIENHIKRERWDRLQQMSERIDTEAKRLYQLLDNLLNWASSQTGAVPYKPEKVSVKELIEENLNLYESAAQAKNISLVSGLSEELEVFADRNGASTILRNLLGNAVKFTPEDGQIRVSAKKEGNHVILTTTDNGVGMDEQKVRTLFQLSGERSKRGTQGEKGTGLGLLLAKEFALLNKGKIWAESQLGQGTTFFVQLPMG